MLEIYEKSQPDLCSIIKNSATHTYANFRYFLPHHLRCTICNILELNRLYKILDLLHCYTNGTCFPKIGYLQIALLAGLLNVGIHQHCLVPGYELYNCEIPPLRHCPNSAIHILWCTLSSGVMNHIVPLVKCQTNERK